MPWSRCVRLLLPSPVILTQSRTSARISRVQTEASFCFYKENLPDVSFRFLKTNAESCFGLNGHSSLRKLYLIRHSNLSNSFGCVLSQKQFQETIFWIYSNGIYKAHKIAFVKCPHFVSWLFLMHFTFFFFFVILRRFGRQRKPIQMRLQMWRSISHSAHLLLLFHRSSCYRSTWEHESSVSQWLF